MLIVNIYVVYMACLWDTTIRYSHKHAHIYTKIQYAHEHDQYHRILVVVRQKVDLRRTFILIRESTEFINLFSIYACSPVRFGMVEVENWFYTA